MLVDEKITTSVVDEDKKSTKEKFLKLKEKLLKPYVLLKKPVEALREFFVNIKSGKVVNTIKNIKEKSIQQQQCNPIYVEMWGLEKYEPRNGNLGVLPSSEYQFDLNYFSWLKNTYGISNIILPEMSIRNNLDNNGPFINSEIFIGFDFDDISTILNCINNWDKGSLAGCYIDEPTENHDVVESTNLLLIVKNFFKMKFGNNSIIVIGDRNERLMNYNYHLADYVNFTHWTDYHYFGPFPKEYFWAEEDQRDAWLDFNNSFNSKFDKLWIYNEDINELYSLIQWGKDHDKSSFWLYCPDVNTIYTFSLVAWQNQYLYRTDRKYYWVYNYIGSMNPCSDENESNWVLIDIVPTNEFYKR
ncbi:MAG: hypothetical protein N2321_04210 [Melioribacteraceae bacterium]|nr:hypothetical protein [Melioribacteraceae bacterium]